MSLLTDGRFCALAPGDHVCAVFADPDEQAEAMARYLGAGIDAGERSVYITDQEAAEVVGEHLEAGGLNVAAAREGGRLQVLTSRESFLGDRRRSATGMVEFLCEAERDALAAGCSGLRVIADMTWALGANVRGADIARDELDLNRFFPGSRSQAICRYDRGRFPPVVIADVLRAHPIAIVGQRVCPNPFHEPPLRESQEDSPGARVDWMIGQLVQLRENELRLQEAIAARDEFLAIASHELRTPLHALNLAVHSLGHSPATEADWARIARQVQRLNHLVDSTFDVSRLRDGQRTMMPEVCDLRAVVEEVVGRFDVEAAHAESPICVALPSIMGAWDRHSLDDIVSNLLSNAVKYGPGQPIDVVGRRVNGHAILTVRDRGVGVPREHRDRIFDRFARAVSSRMYSGFGLGLWVVRENVTAMGGSVRMLEAEGPGSVFEVTLPTGR